MTLCCLDSQEMDGDFAIFNRGRFTITLSRDRLSWSDPSFKFKWCRGHVSDGQ